VILIWICKNREKNKNAQKDVMVYKSHVVVVCIDLHVWMCLLGRKLDPLCITQPRLPVEHHLMILFPGPILAQNFFPKLTWYVYKMFIKHCPKIGISQMADNMDKE
jgi:hypothetical protein